LSIESGLKDDDNNEVRIFWQESIAALSIAIFIWHQRILLTISRPERIEHVVKMRL
jgi:hypothetical protein